MLDRRRATRTRARGIREQRAVARAVGGDDGDDLAGVGGRRHRSRTHFADVAHACEIIGPVMSGTPIFAASVGPPKNDSFCGTVMPSTRESRRAAIDAGTSRARHGSPARRDRCCSCRRASPATGRRATTTPRRAGSPRRGGSLRLAARWPRRCDRSTRVARTDPAPTSSGGIGRGSSAAHTTAPTIAMPTPRIVRLIESPCESWSLALRTPVMPIVVTTKPAIVAITPRITRIRSRSARPPFTLSLVISASNCSRRGPGQHARRRRRRPGLPAAMALDVSATSVTASSSPAVAMRKP